MHLEALNENTKKVWNKFGFLKNFYLAGGTALAMQLGHRISIDLDFFSADPIKKTLLKEVESRFDSVFILINSKNELTLDVDGVKTTFLHYPFPLVEKKIKTPIVPIVSVRDVASMKAYSIGRRATFKDYIDLYIIFFKKILTMESAVSDARSKYKDAFNDRLFLEQLVYTEDIADQSINWLIKPVSKEEIKSFFEKEIQKIIL